jgi:hypothetical protein
MHILISEQEREVYREFFQVPIRKKEDAESHPKASETKQKINPRKYINIIEI